MSNELDVVFWGHSREDYNDMFALSNTQLAYPILEYGIAPSSFNAEQAKEGRLVVSCHDLYDLTLEEVRDMCQESLSELMHYVTSRRDDFVWDRTTSVAKLKAARERALAIFLQDFSSGTLEGRYVSDDLNSLAVMGRHFDYALCAHRFFVDSSQSLESMLLLINKLLRLCDEIRVFPVLDAEGDIPGQLGALLAAIQLQGYGVEVRSVRYHFQKNDNAMLRIWQNFCLI